ncbi:MAG TPA: hypothetical protein VIL86_00020 [Tepidisphaeraceae bacterium]
MTASMLLCGCEIPGAVVYKVAGPPKVEAKFVPAQVPTLVLAENYRNPSSAALEGEALARAVQEELEAHHVVPLVNSSSYFTLRAEKPAEVKAMTISQVGKAVGAKQIIYINIDRSSIEEAAGTEMLKGRMAVYVRVVDAESGETVWPKENSSGWFLKSETPYLRTGGGVNEDFIRRQMTSALSEQIARLFYKWKPEE